MSPSLNARARIYHGASLLLDVDGGVVARESAEIHLRIPEGPPGPNEDAAQ